jgi:branched-subunit amino acid ABC-type transport system permease component
MTTTLVTSFALAVVVQMSITLAFGARPKPVAFPEWVKGNVQIGPVVGRRDQVRCKSYPSAPALRRQAYEDT